VAARRLKFENTSFFCDDANEVKRMNQRLYTFLVVAPHGKVHKVRLPYYAVHLSVICGLAGLAAMASLAHSYAKMLLKVSNYNDLRSEQTALRSEYRALENVVDHTNLKLESLESLAGEVALTYGFGRKGHPGIPRAVLALATQSNLTLDSSYNASLYTFNLLRQAALDPPGDPLARALISVPRYQPWAGVGFERSAVPALWPVRGEITGGFGQRMDPLTGEDAYHAGVDISAPKGTEVDAAGDGVVIWAGRESGYGNEIVIDHGSGLTTVYAHLSRVDVLPGQEVTAGTPIGAVGTTGRTTGPHLHYEVRLHDTPVNPAKYLRADSNLSSAEAASAPSKQQVQ
jgi:murein DD-endopeptidase MepM/ murein hydrolase activator NlpD